MPLATIAGMYTLLSDSYGEVIIFSVVSNSGNIRSGQPSATVAGTYIYSVWFLLWISVVSNSGNIRSGQLPLATIAGILVCEIVTFFIVSNSGNVRGGQLPLATIAGMYTLSSDSYCIFSVVSNSGNVRSG